MAKQDHPTLEFIIERGKLVPADPYVAEVLDTYRNGDKVTATLNQKRSLPLLKKYWAVLRDVVENCKTPWENADQASDALKLALGVTDISKTVNGQWFIRPGSISFASMDENDFRPFFEKSMAVLSEVTGIDPEELRKRYRHIPESSAHPPADEGSDTAASSPSSVAANPSSAQAETSEAGSDNMGESETEPASDDAGEWLKTFAKAIIGAIGPDETVVVNQSKGIFVEGLTDAVRAKARSVTNYARACCRGEIELADCRETIAGVVGCDEKELAS